MSSSFCHVECQVDAEKKGTLRLISVSRSSVQNASGCFRTRRGVLYTRRIIATRRAVEFAFIVRTSDNL